MARGAGGDGEFLLLVCAMKFLAKKGLTEEFNRAFVSGALDAEVQQMRAEAGLEPLAVAG